MMWLWLQALIILTAAFGGGLLIGGFLGRLALTQLQEKAHRAAPKPAKSPASVARTLTLDPEPEVAIAATKEAVPVDYHGYAPEITPLLTPRIDDVMAPPTAFTPMPEPVPEPVILKPKTNLLFPASSFGAMSETIKKQAPIISPLAGLDSKALEAVLANVTRAIEPTRLMGTPSSKDDLQLIDGIGPANEAELWDLGIYYFWQIASWSAEEVVWVAQHIHFPDRIVRENWIKQAANLLMNDTIA